MNLFKMKLRKLSEVVETIRVQSSGIIKFIAEKAPRSSLKHTKKDLGV